MNFGVLVCAVTAVIAVSAARAENWPAWRGPTGQGISSERSVPTVWSRTNGVRWRVPLPDKGNSTPIVWSNRIFLTQSIGAEKRRVMMCLRRSDGSLEWQSGIPFLEAEPTHETNPANSSSPVTDGERVIAWFGSGGLHCYDLSGREIWQRDLGKQRHIWGWGSSPVIHGDLCFLNFGPGKRQFLVALNKRTGEIVWQRDEPGGDSGDARGNEKPLWKGSWSTPLPITVDGTDQLVLSLPGRVAAFLPADGKELWNAAGINDLAYTSPLFSDGVVVAMGGYNGMSLGVRVPGAGDITQTNRLWHHPRTKQRIGSGVIHERHIYIVDDPGIAECIELKTGKVIWEERLVGLAKTTVNWSSAVLAARNVYVITQGGDTFVFDASTQFRLRSVNPLGEVCNASLAISNGEIFIRTHEALWAIRSGN